ncbi:hypothetical protein LX36DRAFT_35450 [Colletotrichum falcatum]|nr:hypothetical protein LX36DRAFT_35450 [Colletotrichum falcatum]
MANRADEPRCRPGPSCVRRSKAAGRSLRRDYHEVIGIHPLCPLYPTRPIDGWGSTTTSVDPETLTHPAETRRDETVSIPATRLSPVRRPSVRIAKNKIKKVTISRRPPRVRNRRGRDADVGGGPKPRLAPGSPQRPPPPPQQTAFPAARFARINQTRPQQTTEMRRGSTASSFRRDVDLSLSLSFSLMPPNPSQAQGPPPHTKKDR